MQSIQANRYFFRADANALGGFLEEPFSKGIPTIAPVSLPAVGGVTAAHSEAVNLDDIIRSGRAYTRVSGLVHASDGSVSILATAVVEDLNILEVIRAQRIVSQVSIQIASGASEPTISFAGSTFEGLSLCGQSRHVVLNPVLSPKDCSIDGHKLPVSWQDVAQVSRTQVKQLLDRFQGKTDSQKWAQQRHAWVNSAPLPSNGGVLLASLVDGLAGDDPKQPSGHVIEIPGFGRIFLGELRVSRDAVQLLAIRAELGCPVRGRIAVGAVGGGGTPEN